MNETALTVRDVNLSETMQLGEVLVKSGFFKDSGDAAQAVVKVLAGRELGFGPIASMTGIEIVQGKPTIGANLLGAAIKGSGRYDYRVTHHTSDRCEIAFFQHGEELGRSEFTMADAQIAGLANKQVWKQYPRNMLFARALSNGARWYCPDVFSGVTPYTPEELGANVDGETGEIIDVTPNPTPTTQAGDNGNDAGPTESVKDKIGKLYSAVTAKTDYYRAMEHMTNAILKQKGDDWIWPPPDDRDAWNGLYNVAMDHAEKRQAEKVKEEPLFPE